MIKRRPADERGGGDHGWLKTCHTFSFNDYHDPAHMGFRVLRVINEDWVQPGQGFGMHGHRDMEIVTYVLEGQLEHKDSMGHGEALRPGEFQRMTAGTGVRHSEFNPSPTELVHLYQIWLLPDKAGHVPSYEQKKFPEADRAGKLRLVASPDGRDGSLTIHQNAEIRLASLGTGAEVAHTLRPGRHAWLQVLRGAVELNGIPLSKGDGAAVSEELSLKVTGIQSAEVMLFDLP